MFLFILNLIITVQCLKGAVTIIFQKSLIIPQGGYSVLNISNDVAQLSGNVMSGQLMLSIVRRNPYTSMKFDAFFFDQQEPNGYKPYTDVLNCYLVNKQQVENLYNQYKSCNLYLLDNVAPNGFAGNLEYLKNTTGINNKGNVFPSRTFIFQNSLFPCQNGTFYPELQLLQTISMTLWPDYLFFDALKISLLVIIQLLVIMGTANYVLYGKLRRLKKKLAEIKEKSKVSDLFTSLDEMKKTTHGVNKPRQAPMELREYIEGRPKRLNSDARQIEVRQIHAVSQFIMKADSIEF